MNHHYSFSSNWKIKASIEEVWCAIYESEQWPQWWPNVVSVRELQKGGENDIGNIREYKIKSPMLYTLTFSLQLTEKTEYQFLQGNASGELSGVGNWRFTENAGVTHIQCNWKVSTNIGWMNKLAFLLRPAFAFNHSVVMKNGAKALSRLLNAELITAC